MRFLSLRMRSSAAGMMSGSISLGKCPSSPISTALSVPWPRPVSASEPNTSARTRAVRARSAVVSLSQRWTKRAAARIGPTVCEELGPMPILNKSKLLTATCGTPEAPRGMASGAIRYSTRPAGPGPPYCCALRCPTHTVLMPELTLFQRDDCHLCDLALEVLAAARSPEFESVFIDEDESLEARYGIRVPVLRDEARGMELDWPFDVEGVLRFLAR